MKELKTTGAIIIQNDNPEVLKDDVIDKSRGYTDRPWLKTKKGRNKNP